MGRAISIMPYAGGGLCSCLLPVHRIESGTPVCASMVEHPAEYRWSSFLANAQGESSTILTLHDIYKRLGFDERSRQQNYRELFRYHLDFEARIKIQNRGLSPVFKGKIKIQNRGLSPVFTRVLQQNEWFILFLESHIKDKRGEYYGSSCLYRYL